MLWWSHLPQHMSRWVLSDGCVHRWDRHRKCDGILQCGTEPGCYSTNYTNCGTDVSSSPPPTIILVMALFRRRSKAVKYQNRQVFLMETEGSDVLGCNCLCFLFLCEWSREAFDFFFLTDTSRGCPWTVDKDREAEMLQSSCCRCSLLPALLLSTPVHSVPLLYHTLPSSILIDSTLVCLTRPHWNRRYPHSTLPPLCTPTAWFDSYSIPHCCTPLNPLPHSSTLLYSTTQSPSLSDWTTLHPTVHTPLLYFILTRSAQLNWAERHLCFYLATDEQCNLDFT